MYIYNYDRDTLEFLFVSEPQKNPLKEGEYLFPKNSTTVIPPVLNKREAALFVDGIWRIVPDFRGDKIINPDTKESFIVSDLGDIPSGFMLYEDYVKTDMYQDYLQQIEEANTTAEILGEIKSIDEKRIRAICEPSIRDINTGETWLEYYNKQIVSLRQRLSEVEYGA